MTCGRSVVFSGYSGFLPSVKTGCHDITDILSKVALNTINQTISLIRPFEGVFDLFVLKYLIKKVYMHNSLYPLNINYMLISSRRIWRETYAFCQQITIDSLIFLNTIQLWSIEQNCANKKKEQIFSSFFLNILIQIAT